MQLYLARQGKARLRRQAGKAKHTGILLQHVLTAAGVGLISGLLPLRVKAWLL